MEPRLDVRARVAALIPIAGVVAADPWGWYPFGPAKIGAISVAVLAAATACLWTGVRPVTGRLARGLALTWIVLLGWIVVSASFGVDGLYRWVGTPERRLGVLTWGLFAVAAWVGTQVGTRVEGDGADPTRPLRRSVVVATAWSGAYGLIEWWWRAPIEIEGVTDRLGGPFGSASYFGAALCLLLPVTAGVAADRVESTVWRVAAATSVVVGAVCLVGTGTRAAWVGFAAGAVVVSTARRPRWRQVALAGGVVVVASLVMLPRLGDVTDRSAPWDSRLDEWALAVDVITDRPIVGAGPEGYRIVVSQAVDAEYEARYGREALPDRAHSAPLDVAAIAGLPGAVGYLVLMALAALAAWRALRARPELAGLSAAVIAYGVQQLLLFPVAELDPIWWLSIGALATAGAERPASASGRRMPVFATIAGGAACVAFVVGITGVAADRAARTALDDASGTHARRAADLRPDVLRYHLLEASFGASEQSLAGVDAELAAARRATDVSPRDPLARRAVATAFGHRAAVTGEPADVDAAIDAWEAIVADDPSCGLCWFELGATAALAGIEATATDAWRRAAELGGPTSIAATSGLERLARSSGGAG